MSNAPKGTNPPRSEATLMVSYEDHQRPKTLDPANRKNIISKKKKKNKNFINRSQVVQSFKLKLVLGDSPKIFL